MQRGPSRPGSPPLRFRHEAPAPEPFSIPPRRPASAPAQKSRPKPEELQAVAEEANQLRRLRTGSGLAAEPSEGELMRAPGDGSQGQPPPEAVAGPGAGAETFAGRVSPRGHRRTERGGQRVANQRPLSGRRSRSPVSRSAGRVDLPRPSRSRNPSPPGREEFGRRAAGAAPEVGRERGASPDRGGKPSGEARRPNRRPMKNRHAPRKEVREGGGGEGGSGGGSVARGSGVGEKPSSQGSGRGEIETSGGGAASEQAIPPPPNLGPAVALGLPAVGGVGMGGQHVGKLPLEGGSNGILATPEPKTGAVVGPSETAKVGSAGKSDDQGLLAVANDANQFPAVPVADANLPGQLQPEAVGKGGAVGPAENKRAASDRGKHSVPGSSSGRGRGGSSAGDARPVSNRGGSGGAAGNDKRRREPRSRDRSPAARRRSPSRRDRAGQRDDPEARFRQRPTMLAPELQARYASRRPPRSESEERGAVRRPRGTEQPGADRRSRGAEPIAARRAGDAGNGVAGTAAGRRPPEVALTNGVGAEAAPAGNVAPPAVAAEGAVRPEDASAGSPARRLVRRAEPSEAWCYKDPGVCCSLCLVYCQVWFVLIKYCVGSYEPIPPVE